MNSLSLVIALGCSPAKYHSLLNTEHRQFLQNTLLNVILPALYDFELRVTQTMLPMSKPAPHKVGKTFLPKLIKFEIQFEAKRVPIKKSMTIILSAFST